MRQSAHALLDASFDKMEAASEGRVWNPVPEDLKASLDAPLPVEGTSADAVCDSLRALLPYGVGNTHPRFFGWVHGAGNPGGVLPELVASAMNANCGGRDHAAIYVEKQVLRWCRSMMGFPSECGALLVSGTSMATIVALKAARDKALGFTESRRTGLLDAQQAKGRLVGYAADGTHSCVQQAFDVLGLGTEALRKVPVTDSFTMDVAKLVEMVEADRAAGLRPFVVVGTAGSVNVGAIDDLASLADAAAAQGLWFHVDGAFGATAVLSDEVRPRLEGMARADSLAFDFHKWLYDSRAHTSNPRLDVRSGCGCVTPRCDSRLRRHVNYDCGCVLVRDHDAHLRSFSERPDYLTPKQRGLAAHNPWPTDYGVELSRGFRALKVYAHLLEHGTAKLGRAITANLAHAQHLAALIDQAGPTLQRLAPTTLQIVVFRYVPEGLPLSEEELDALNDELVIELQERGIAAPSTTRIKGKLAIRVNLTNHRTRFPDLELLIDAVKRIGAELATIARGQAQTERTA